MTFKKILTILIAFIATTATMATPTPKFDEDSYIAEQHKYILKEVKFSADEAKKFFALYDEMRAKQRLLFNKMRKDRRKAPSTDSECRAIIVARDKDNLELMRISQQYHAKMLKVLPAKKVLDALVAADEFDKTKFKEMNSKKDQCKNKCNKQKCNNDCASK